ncbi:MAG: rhodanese-related sulfurtransferase [Bradymonadia bacterium]
MSYTIAAFYHFATIEDPSALSVELEMLCLEVGVKGLIIVANEGVNGTISGSGDAVESILNHLKLRPEFRDIEAKFSYARKDPMVRIRVVQRAEIVTLGIDDIDPRVCVGEYIEPSDWNQIVDDPNICVIDTRNGYEYNIGTFEGALNPETETFTEFPQWVDENREHLESFDAVAMFCTGGIRCEKATGHLLQSGFKKVLHLKGGILKYLEEVDVSQTRWSGDCFVFDRRVSVDHQLEPGTLTRCRGCRHPLNLEDRARPEYEEGVSCHRCIGRTSEAQKARFRERKSQVELAEARGESHLDRNSHFEKTRHSS